MPMLFTKGLERLQTISQVEAPVKKTNGSSGIGGKDVVPLVGFFVIYNSQGVDDCQETEYRRIKFFLPVPDACVRGFCVNVCLLE